MEQISKNQVIKNRQYESALNEYLECIKIEFNKIKRSDNFDSYLHNSSWNKACLNQANEIKNIINNGGLDYDQFTH